MNKRLCYNGRKWRAAIGTISLCCLSVACSDEYLLDDENPTWLGKSIYDELVQRGNFTNFVRIIDSLDYAEVLSKTGSKTLFVANDSAFDAFYRSNNPWKVKSFKDLTKAQMRLLLNSAMINNAYLLEMMSSTSSSTETPIKGECLRRFTALSALDSIPFFKGDELPIIVNENDTDYWKPFRKSGIHMALDATQPMMVHFLPAQLLNHNITNEDFEIITRRKRTATDAYVYNCKVVEKDITCQNGYINRLESVLLPPQNMAEVLRTNDSTQIISHMMDRFSAPFYNASLTNSYRNMTLTNDTVYEKRYFSKSSQGGLVLNSDIGTNPTDFRLGNTVHYGLNFDPGWNTYYPDKISTESDMGVIFAPTDDKLYHYFFDELGGGNFLIKAYAEEEGKAVAGPNDKLGIYKAIDRIPLDVIQAFLNNLMKISFNSSVPSKFETIKDDAQDPMLDATHINNINNVKIASNGIIYVMDEVITPAKYSAVSAPSYVGKDMKIFKYAVEKDVLDIPSNFYAYLLAMSARFSFFVPYDEDFWYIDPVSFAMGNGNQRALKFTWNAKSGSPNCTAYKLIYDYTTGTGIIDTTTIITPAPTNNEINNRLRDLLETHTIVHDEDKDYGVEWNKQYFLSKNGCPIFVSNAKLRDKGMTVAGGWQKQHNEVSNVIHFDNKAKQYSSDGRLINNGNGFAYKLDAPMLPTIESVYSVLYNDPEFQEFFDLCQVDPDVFKALEINKDIAEKNKYSVFINNNGLPAYDKVTGNQVATETNVKYFNNYRYTVYIPTNEAIREAIANGLPTWQQIKDVLYPETDQTAEEEAAAKEKALTMLTCLINFIKNHFQDNSVFIDYPSIKDAEYETATLKLDEENNPTVYARVKLNSNEGELGLTITDARGQVRHVTNKNNILTRDYNLGYESKTKPTTIQASSSAVIHQIDGVLDYKNYANGRYDSDWSTPAAAKEYLKHYRILE